MIAPGVNISTRKFIDNSFIFHNKIVIDSDIEDTEENCNIYIMIKIFVQLL